MELEHNAYLVLPRLHVQNLNTISSPMTWGAPAITAAMGFMLALQRKVPFDWELDLLTVGMVIHDFEPQVNGGFVKKFSLTRNPLGKDGKTPGIIEEGRAHATISLVFGVYVAGDTSDELLQERARTIYKEASAMRFAGGSIIYSSNTWYKPQILMLPEDQAETQHTLALKRSLLPGFALISRDDVLVSHTKKLQEEEPELTALDAWLDLSRINKRCVVTRIEQPSGEIKETVGWQSDREKGSGWLVPIPVGYSALSELYKAGEVQNARDPHIPFRFVESMYSIGEWCSPHRLSSLNELLWSSHADHEAGIYRCINHNSN
ncbi:type I-F CRISPR-associated protein Csy2 [Parahaliea sp. F7430]|uniref:Type I-F CRISPR-associated protein Csy2 n=1 Tax=Sediminihaliea albiluteola TaxID=2758564 RepID=A0A7W2TUA3_9GAMM|nr:type I-F CRISPR-associated protein Csy2 [Sediminihaliea albiluteola]MBA6412058.1 type I-F CRISPR-associated protein Csy2 [Sediminihaliea albiluteola]